MRVRASLLETEAPVAPSPPSALLSNSRLSRSWLARTDPKDVARVESKTVIVTKNQRDTVPIPAAGMKSQLGSWMSESDWQRARQERFPGCMAGSVCARARSARGGACVYYGADDVSAGRTMFVIPFSMGPVGSTLSKYGVQVPDWFVQG